MRRRTSRLYSFGLHTLNFGDKVRRGTNPFTGETTVFHIDNGLSKEQLKAMQAVFDRHGISGPEPESDDYARYGPGHESLRFRCCDLAGSNPIISVSVEIIADKIKAYVLRVILDVARAGGCALTTSEGYDNVRIVEDVPNKQVLARWPCAQPISSEAELRTWLESVVGSREVVVFDHG